MSNQRGWHRLNGLTATETLQAKMMTRLVLQAMEFVPALYDTNSAHPVVDAMAKAMEFIHVVDLTPDYPPSLRGAPNSMVQYVSAARNGDWSKAAAAISGKADSIVKAAHGKTAQLRAGLLPVSQQEIDYAKANLHKILARKLTQSPAMSLRLTTLYEPNGLRIDKIDHLSIRLTAGALQ